MIATHQIILFAAITLVNANFPLVGPKRNGQPGMSLYERIRTCNEGLSDCRSIADADIQSMARFVDIMLEDGPISIFHLIDNSPLLDDVNNRVNKFGKSALVKDLNEKKTTLSLLRNLVYANDLVNEAYNKQNFMKEQGWPSIDVPGRHELTQGKIIKFLTSRPFERLKKQFADFLKELVKRENFSKLRPLKQRLCSNFVGLRRSSRDLRPVNYDYEFSGDVELQRTKRHVDVTTKLTEGCIFSDSYKFRQKHCTQGALIDYGLTDFLLSVTTNYVSIVRNMCK